MLSCIHDMTKHRHTNQQRKVTTTMATPNATATTDNYLTTKHLAARFNMKGTQLRRILRSMQDYADGVHTNYRWDEKADANKIKAIEAKIKDLAAKKQARAAEAKAKLATPAAK